MTPKEKADELFELFYQNAPDLYGTGKAHLHAEKFAIILVDEILRLPSMNDGRMIVLIKKDYDYWRQVKQEIQKL